MSRFLIFILLIGFCFNYAFADEIPAELSKKYNQKLEFKQKTYDQLNLFINQNPDSPYLPHLYYQLAELSIEIDVTNPGKTADFFEAVLQNDNNYPDKDVVLYNIAYYRFLEIKNNRDEARINNVTLAPNWPNQMRLSEQNLQPVIDSYSTIIHEFPQSDYYTEAYYRLGNIYLEIALDSRRPQEFYPTALDYFDYVAQSNDDVLKNYGLFQRGWTYFYSNDFEKALNDFNTILKIIDNDTEHNFKIYFEDDAVENIAFSLIEYDGIDYDKASVAAEKALILFQNYFNDDYAREILHKAIDLDITYSAPMRAIDLYNAMIKLYPDYVNTPAYVDSIINLYIANPLRIRDEYTVQEKVISENERLINEYTVNSGWYKKNKTEDISLHLNIIRNAYDLIEPRYFNIFVSDRSETNYDHYCKLIEYFSAYPEFQDESGLIKLKQMQKNRAEMAKVMANESGNPSYYFIAIDDLKSYNKSYPEDSLRFNYKEDIFYSYEKIYEILQDTIKTTPYIDSVHQIYMDKDDLENIFINASIDFEDALKDTIYLVENRVENLIRIIDLRAELRYARGEFKSAESDYLELLDYQLTNDRQTLIYSRLAEIANRNEDYLVEETYYRKAEALALPEDKAVYKNNYLASIQSHAEQLYAQGLYDSSAVEYLRLSDEFGEENESKGIGFRLKAIDAYKNDGLYQKAIDQYMNIAEIKKTKNDVFSACHGAWSISDTILMDWNQSEYIRYYFIDRFPASNEAYKLRLQIISFYEGEIFADTLTAAQMYLDLHNEIDGIDYGDDNPARLYLKAIKIFKDSGEEDLAVKHMIAFEKIYPEHPRSMDFLKNIALIYDERGDEENFEKMARYIYKKDPQVDLLSEVAINKLRNIKTDIDSLFVGKHYNRMNEKIDEFATMDRDYQKEGLSLPLDSIYEIFQYYQDYQRYYENYEDYLLNVHNDFLEKNPDQLIRVNDRTEWKTHIIGQNRISNVMQQCETIRAEMIELITDGANYEIPTAYKTRGLYTVALCYEHGAYAVETQIKKFTDVSRQLNNETLDANPIQQKQYKDNLMAQGKKLSFKFTKKAVEVYNYILSSFYDNKDYSDVWTDQTYAKLVKMGLRSAKIYEYVNMDTLWTISGTNVDLDSIVYFDSLAILQTSLQSETLQRVFDAEIKMDVMFIDYYANQKLKILVNGKSIENNYIVADSIQWQGKNLIHYQNRISSLVKKGENTISFKKDSESEDSLLIISPKLTFQYDKEKLEFYRSTELITYYTDEHWFTAKGDLGDNPQVDSTWIYAGDDNFRFYKSQMYGLESSEAKGLWYPIIDTTAVQSCYFSQVIELNSEIVEANIKFIGQNNTTIWLNGEKIVDNYSLVLDKQLNKAESVLIPLTGLREGENLLTAKVIGDVVHKGFIAEVEIRVRNYEALNDLPNEESGE